MMRAGREPRLMVFRKLEAAPESAVEPERRGRVVGRFCHGCGGLYPLYRPRHRDKPALGRDHVASPCTHEGEAFEPGGAWWEPAVEVLAPPAAAAAE